MQHHLPQDQVHLPDTKAKRSPNQLHLNLEVGLQFLMKTVDPNKLRGINVNGILQLASELRVDSWLIIVDGGWGEKARETVGKSVVPTKWDTVLNCKGFATMPGNQEAKSLSTAEWLEDTMKVDEQELEAHYITWKRFRRSLTLNKPVRPTVEPYKQDLVMSDLEDSTVTYTEAPQSLDYVPGPEEPEQAPLLPEFVPEPVYPEFMPPEDEVFLAEEQPLPATVSPTTDSPGYIADSDPEEDEEDPKEDLTDYPADEGDDDDDDDESSDDDEDDDDVEEDADEEEEEHLAPSDSIPPPVHRVTARMSVRAQTPISLPFVSLNLLSRTRKFGHSTMELRSLIS
ncbi:hypothetical protein Tco_0560006 [Tanacetum coccineum]